MAPTEGRGWWHLSKQSPYKWSFTCQLCTFDHRPANPMGTYYASGNQSWGHLSHLILILSSILICDSEPHPKPGPGGPARGLDQTQADRWSLQEPSLLLEHKFVPPSVPSHPLTEQSMRRCWANDREASVRWLWGKSTCHQA